MSPGQLEKEVSLPLESGSTSGILHLPRKGAARKGIVIAHGAGNDMNFPLLVRLAREAAREGWAALRFNFPYRNEGRKSPDRQEVLEDSWRSACAKVRSGLAGKKKTLVGAGKSLGGRVASQMVAREELPVNGLVFLGYPLHPPGKKDHRRDAHLYEICEPMLFFVGTRDSLCDLDTLQDVIGHLTAPCDLKIIEGGDHSFHVPKSAGVSREEIDRRIVENALLWLRKKFS